MQRVLAENKSVRARKLVFQSRKVAGTAPIFHLTAPSKLMAASNSPERVKPPMEAILQCIAAISNALNGREDYAIIGGAALIATGFKGRTTEDVDVLVRVGTTFSIKNILSTHLGFSLDVRTRHLLFTPDPPDWTIPIDVLTPSLAHIPETEISEAVESDAGARIVRPAALLNYKISSSYTRSTVEKKMTDWTDVEYLINWHLFNGITLSPGAIRNATVEAFYDGQNWTSGMITEEDWSAIGGALPSKKATGRTAPTEYEMLLPQSRLKKLKTQQKFEAERNKVLAEKKVAAKAHRQAIIQRTAAYVKEYREREEEQIRLKRLAKKEGNLYGPPDPKLAFVVRIKGSASAFSF